MKSEGFIESLHSSNKEVRMFKNILVAVDGSEHGLKAARVAGDMARCMQADLWVVVAYDPLPGYMGQPYLQEVITARMDDSEQIFSSALAEIGEIPEVLHKEVLEGPPAEAILAVEDTREIDLIVMGTRGLNRLASIVMGSQSQKVIANANCPVLLVR
jgi:nucleotide-binding universal stress UspA family protein